METVESFIHSFIHPFIQVSDPAPSRFQAPVSSNWLNCSLKDVTFHLSQRRRPDPLRGRGGDPSAPPWDPKQPLSEGPRPTRTLSAHREHKPELPERPHRNPHLARPPGKGGPLGPEEGEAGLAPARGPEPAPPRPALAPAAGSAPPPPYQGFGYVPPLGDVFAVLLVSHPDPLFGHHGSGARKCSRLPLQGFPRVSPGRGRARPARPGRCRWQGAAPEPRAPRSPAPNEPAPERGQSPDGSNLSSQETLSYFLAILPVPPAT